MCVLKDLFKLIGTFSLLWNSRGFNGRVSIWGVDGRNVGKGIRIELAYGAPTWSKGGPHSQTRVTKLDPRLLR